MPEVLDVHFDLFFLKDFLSDNCIVLCENYGNAQNIMQRTKSYEINVS